MISTEIFWFKDRAAVIGGTAAGLIPVCGCMKQSNFGWICTMAIILVIGAASEPILAQTLGNDPNPVYHHRLSQQHMAMTVLLGWGLTNLAAGSVLAAASPGYRDFGYMTAGWGLVNAGIAAFSLYSGPPFDPQTVTLAEYLRDEQLFNRILAINSGLNVAYIGVGAGMARWGSSSRIRQFGSAIILQGAFLMAFDAFLLYHSSARLGDALLFVDSIGYLDIGNRLHWSPALTMRLML
ncbi:MAG: hypothetical protein EA364_12605 [Balneolaceae bacterium]|nr:MAG: hypothetical protein EA364_12605 [Balneolaceae bacterium]